MKINAHSSYAIIDTQSVKTISASEELGLNGGKTIKGRKRHIVVDAMGNLLSVKVHAANIHDTRSGIWPAEIALANYPEIKKFCTDARYSGTFVDTMKEKFQMDVDVVKRGDSGQWQVLPERWIVERTFA